jgi:hypothetical protein
MKPYPPRQQPPNKSSRREFLAMLGIGGAGVGICACGGIAGLIWALTRDPEVNEPDDENLPTPIVERYESNYVYPDMISRAEWGALPPDHDARNEHGFYSEDNAEGWRVYDGNLRDDYQTVIIHHSAEYFVSDLLSVLDIQKSHRSTRGWADVAYHYFVGKSGDVFEGRDIGVRGTHVQTYNTGSVGVCLLGDFIQESPTDAQIESTGKLVNWLATHLQLTHLAGHRDFNETTLCPGDRLIPYLDSFANQAELQRGIDGYIRPDNQETSACPCCMCNL